MFVQYAPYKLAEGNWDRSRKRSPTAASKCWPLRPQRARARSCIGRWSSPLDLERMFGLTGGNIFQGAMTPQQLFCFRPVVGWADHRTPVERALSLWRGQPSRRRRDGGLRQERRRRNLARSMRNRQKRNRAAKIVSRGPKRNEKT